jgi:alpha-galactosidase
MRDGSDAVLGLRAAGTSVVVDAGGRMPRLLHWGADLGPLDGDLAMALLTTATPAILNNSPDSPRVLSLWPTESESWAGTPAQSGHAAGTATTPRPELTSVLRVEAPEGGGTLSFQCVDRVTALRSELVLTLDAFGVLTVDMSVLRDGALAAVDMAPYSLDGLRALLPLPERATELLDFTGKWCRERSPQRSPLSFGSHVRRARRGKPGHDSPYLLAVGTAGFGFRHGEVWATHLAWSGDGEYLAERLPEGAGALASVLGAGEGLRPGEVLLSDGDEYVAPTVYFVWSDQGLDGIAERLHRRTRARSTHPATPRPLTLNSWEALYFDHDLDRINDLVERAAQIGVERFVLDDGWFHGRRGPNAGLGDWHVDADVWPEGLKPLVDLVREHGMQFGLWFEPEMINLDSEIAREHPDWVLGPRDGLGASSRAQFVLDVGRQDAYDYVLARVSALVREYDIDYIKWDHNRDLIEAVGRRDGGDRPAVRQQTLALYRMLDELRRRHPGLEIETCSGGGGRVDLGMLERTDRLWASDCNDPVERALIERWTRMLIPPELIGSHLGAERSHTTSRRTDLPFRLATALTAHAGVEWNLAEATDDELKAISTWADLYRELRHLIHSGRVVNADLPDEATLLSGIVAQDGSRALYTWTRLASSTDGQTGRVRLPGLCSDAHYLVRVREEIGQASRHETADPAWLDLARDRGVHLPGTVLAVAGLPLPTLNPQQALLLDVTRLPH